MRNFNLPFLDLQDTELAFKADKRRFVYNNQIPQSAAV